MSAPLYLVITTKPYHLAAAEQLPAIEVKLTEYDTKNLKNLLEEAAKRLYEDDKA